MTFFCRGYLPSDLPLRGTARTARTVRWSRSSGTSRSTRRRPCSRGRGPCGRLPLQPRSVNSRCIHVKSLTPRYALYAISRFLPRPSPLTIRISWSGSLPRCSVDRIPLRRGVFFLTDAAVRPRRPRGWCPCSATRGAGRPCRVGPPWALGEAETCSPSKHGHACVTVRASLRTPTTTAKQNKGQPLSLRQNIHAPSSSRRARRG